MPFIGQQPTTGTFVELDSLTASATADYTLQLNGANYEPESVNNLLVSINGVIQGSSTMSLSGSTLTVGATLSSSDVIDFVRVFGNVGTISTPTDGSVTANKIGNNAVDLTTKVTGILPVANGGTGTSTSTDNITTLNSGGVDVNGTIGADFTGLPSGIKRIQVNLYRCSASGSDTGALIRLGTSGSFVSSGYSSISHYGSGGQSDSSGFFLYGTGGTNAINGIATINNMGSDRFISSHSLMYSGSNGAFGGGYKDLGGTLDRLTVRLVSGGNFDFGRINVMYEL